VDLLAINSLHGPHDGDLIFEYTIKFMFIAVVNYLIDIYGPFAASALTANAILRSLFGCASPLLDTSTFVNLGDS